MLSGLALASLVAAGAPWPAVAAVALALLRPWWAAALLAAGLAARFMQGKPAPVELEARFLDSFAAELRSGASWRTALDSAARRVSGLDLANAATRSRAGLAAAQVAPALGAALPTLGRSASAALRLVAATGAPAATVFGALADQAALRADEARERSAATSQARLSAMLVGGAPAALAVAMLATGRGEAALASGPAGPVLLAVGLGLITAGAAAVALMLRAAAR